MSHHRRRSDSSEDSDHAPLIRRIKKNGHSEHGTALPSRSSVYSQDPKESKTVRLHSINDPNRIAPPSTRSLDSKRRASSKEGRRRESDNLRKRAVLNSSDLSDYTSKTSETSGSSGSRQTASSKEGRRRKPDDLGEIAVLNYSNLDKHTTENGGTLRSQYDDDDVDDDATVKPVRTKTIYPGSSISSRDKPRTSSAHKSGRHHKAERAGSAHPSESSHKGSRTQSESSHRDSRTQSESSYRDSPLTQLPVIAEPRRDSLDSYGSESNYSGTQPPAFGRLIPRESMPFVPVRNSPRGPSTRISTRSSRPPSTLSSDYGPPAPYYPPGPPVTLPYYPPPPPPYIASRPRYDPNCPDCRASGSCPGCGGYSRSLNEPRVKIIVIKR